MKHNLQLLLSLAVVRLDSNASSRKKAPEGLEATRIMGIVNRTQGEKKVQGREESCEVGREGGVVAMPAYGWKGGAKIRDHRKTKRKREGGKEGTG